MLAGTSLGMTSVFYYLAVKYIDVSIGIVLLMQTVWMGVLLEMILDKKCPFSSKNHCCWYSINRNCIGYKFFKTRSQINWRGIIWGF